MTDAQIERHLIDAGVKNMREDYPNCTAENILTDMVYGPLFAWMLRSNLGKRRDVDPVIYRLLARIDSLAKVNSQE